MLKRPITILGGGLAGLTLGIGLRRRAIPVTILEGGHYPRHRVCGEFISGGGQETLARLDVLEAVLHAGARTASTAAFFLPKQADSSIQQLAQSALCLSRFKLDALLAEHFRNLGGDLRENSRARLENIAQGTIRATGRRPYPTENGARWFGLKIHARNLPLIADLEMHVFQNGYVGLCRLPEDEVNVCGLFRSSSRVAAEVTRLKSPEEPNSSKEATASFPRLLQSFPIPGSSRLHQRLSSAEFDETSFCSVAGLSLKPQRAASLHELSIGDALTMTPPVTGNGMSIAFESAEMAVEPLAQYSQGEISWPVAQQQIARACDAVLASRLRWAKWLQWMMFSPLFQNHLGPLALRSQLLWNVFFRRTRDIGFESRLTVATQK